MSSLSESILSQNYFELFQIEPATHIDTAALTKQYLALQKMAHPDQYVSQGASQMLLAEQLSAFVNEAYQCIKLPLTRYFYLLKLKGVDFVEHTHQDNAFLMQQMMLREELEDAADLSDPESALENLQAKVDDLCSEFGLAFKQEYDQAEYISAYNQAVKMQFLHKLQVEIEQLEDELL